ncbi:MAG: hypothetical protein OXFUSZZB_000577 [Candidatus Fervidibacter sp.]|jgi:EAL domain-containing protein (putative c-di-GMP-specific phosphodiesterase class I)
MPCERCHPVHCENGMVCGVIIHTTAPTALDKLQPLKERLGIPMRELLPRIFLLEGEEAVLERLLSEWQENLSEVEIGETKAALLKTAQPAGQDLTTALLSLRPLNEVVVQLQSLWFHSLLSGQGLFVVFHPLVALEERRVAAYECLLRARLNSKVIGAGQLLAAARSLGRLHQLDQLARRTAIGQGKELLAKGFDLFINFAPNSIYDPKTCLRDTVALCQQLGVDLSQLVFEVIEAEQVRDMAHLKGIIAEYRRQGAKVALDDLGSGYASLRYLAELQPDFVKLDQELVRGAHGDRVRSVLLQAVAEAAHQLGIGVVAEGVETADDANFCRDIGVDLAQGYFFARPASPPPSLSDEAQRWLANL